MGDLNRQFPFGIDLNKISRDLLQLRRHRQRKRSLTYNFHNIQVNSPKQRQSYSKLRLMLSINVFRKKTMKVKKIRILVQFQIYYFTDIQIKSLIQTIKLIFHWKAHFMILLSPYQSELVILTLPLTPIYSYFKNNLSNINITFYNC